jgi:hypothetical protein
MKKYIVRFVRSLDWPNVGLALLMIFVAVMLVVTTIRKAPDVWAWYKKRQAETPVVYKSTTTGTLTLRYPDGRVEVTTNDPPRSAGEYVLVR